MKVLVAYESRGGRTRQAATAIADPCRADGHDVALLPLAQVGQSEVDQCDVAALGSWVEGFILFGVKPARAATRWLDQAPPLAGKPVGVFVTYAVNPRRSLGFTACCATGLRPEEARWSPSTAAGTRTLRPARPTSLAASWPPAESFPATRLPSGPAAYRIPRSLPRGQPPSRRHRPGCRGQRSDQRLCETAETGVVCL